MQDIDTDERDQTGMPLRPSQGKRQPRAAALAAAALSLALAACSSDSGSKSASSWGLTRPDWNLFTKEPPKARTVTAQDLIGPDGRCAGEPAPPSPQALNFQAGPQVPGPPTDANPPPAAPGAPVASPPRRGVGLGMTECEVVYALGHTDRIEFSTAEQGRRSVVLTYPQGERPGIYRFVAGQLVSIERTAEPPAPPKPAAKPKKTAKQKTS